MRLIQKGNQKKIASQTFFICGHFGDGKNIFKNILKDSSKLILCVPVLAICPLKMYIWSNQVM